MTPHDVFLLAEQKKIQMIDFKFVDVPGMWQHFTVPLHELTPEVFAKGIGFDGSSIRGFKSIEESDMLLIPDPDTAFMDPFDTVPTLSLTCRVVETGGTEEPFEFDPRTIAIRAEQYLKSTGVADVAYFGPEAEFFIFDHVEYHSGMATAGYKVDSVEGIWNSGNNGNSLSQNSGYKIRAKEGYFPVAPSDQLQDLRSEMTVELERAGIVVERQHHEVATAGQAEIDIRYDSLLRQADKLMVFKYIVKNVARRRGKTVTFMPKPLFGDNGSGMHTHQSLWKNGQPLFAGNGYAGLSQLALWYAGGLLKHAPALLAICAPSTNSYKRLVPGYEAPVNLVYSSRNRSAAIRIPTYSQSPAAKRLEFRPPDPSCNPYLAFAALLMAGLDGIEKQIDPGAPFEEDVFSLSPERLKNIPHVPGSLADALSALEQDHDFLLKDKVFTENMIRSWIDMKRKKDVDPIRLRPHPYEFQLYYDV